MGLQSVGSETAQRIVFNSGILTVSGERMCDVSDITVNMKFDIKSYRTLNSIKKRAQRRATFDASVSCTLYGFQTNMYELFFSSSSPVANGLQYTIKDGQQDDTNIYLTCYVDDDTTKPIQYKLVDPIFSSQNSNLATEEFGQMPVEIICQDIELFVDSDAAN